ncbi:MAG: sigma 54-interacting transcriptional regulator [Candidatus Sumerlaeia bacterium]|nr:sigma 54-interacting transcriptional regulator [Candidatus Sumerlaeia bacterium]
MSRADAQPIGFAAPSLLAIRGPLTGLRIELAVSPYTIGRSGECNMVLEDALVSRLHARLVRDRLAWRIEDAGSRQGIRVNGEVHAGARLLAPNDEIEIGGSLFLFDSEFDLQNAEFADRSVYYAGPSDDTVEIDARHLPPDENRDDAPSDALALLVSLGRLLESQRITFGDALQAGAERIARIFRADVTVLSLWDSAAGTLRPSAVISERDVLVDSKVQAHVFRERRATLVSDRPNLAPHPSGNAPAPPLVRSLLCAPLLCESGPTGVVSVERHELDAYSLRDLQVLQAVGSLLGVFIDARQRAEALRAKLNFALSESPIVGKSSTLAKALQLAHRVAATPATVLLTGETGTGKELFAREIHRLSPRGEAAGPYVAVNCSAIPESLFESELFGHERGSFTGAVRQQRGYAEQAHGGTLFLDEIGEVAPAMQPKLLRFLQERTFYRVGGTRPLKADVRVVAATNRNLLDEVAKGRFREDLYHRLAVIVIDIPPLRERRSDIRELVNHFVALHARSIGREIAGITDEAMIALERYAWPGNVRELSNCIERAILLCDGKVLTPGHFLLAPAKGQDPPVAPEPAGPPRIAPLADIEREHILRVMKHCQGNQVKASELLGIHRNTLRKKLDEYGVR